MTSKTVNLVPATASKAPDYLCTWNIQGYVTDYASSDAMRRAMTEANLLGSGKLEGWVNMFPKARQDLFLVMDDSWDVPLDGDKKYFGSLILNEQRFPSYQGSPAERMKHLVADVKAKGWKGLGGWVCAQQAPALAIPDEDAYWTQRLEWARESGMAYWKVDWGAKDGNEAWRRRLTELKRTHAPDLVIEHAMVGSGVSFSDVYRTYDVEVVTSAPETIKRVAELVQRKTEPGAGGLVNCEDEPYIAAGLGCAIGVMRHGFDGTLPNGRQDHPYPPVGRNLKKRLDEVTRGVRWHRIAPPFAVGTNPAHVDSVIFTDDWVFHASETWIDRKPGDRVEVKAPARVTRGLPLPEVQTPAGTVPPFVLASRYPQGPIAIVTVGRTLSREYVTPAADVTVQVGDLSHPIGVFGVFGSLTLICDAPPQGCRVLAQDLAGDAAVDITDRVRFDGAKLTIPGAVIKEVGLMAATPGDLSEPGMVLAVVPVSADR